MAPTRRGFLGSIVYFAAACVVDPKLGLCVPGRKPEPIVETIVPTCFISMDGKRFSSEPFSEDYNLDGTVVTRQKLFPWV